jgi:hypothetical protein
MIEDLSGKNLLEVPDKSRIISSPMDGFLLVGGYLTSHARKEKSVTGMRVTTNRKEIQGSMAGVF